MAKTLEQMRTDPEIQAAANRYYEAALRMPRPACYADRGDDEWAWCVKTMIEDLMRLVHQDGCVAAAWALSMIEASSRVTVTT